jgi:hypothetical protein
MMRFLVIDDDKVARNHLHPAIPGYDACLLRGKFDGLKTRVQVDSQVVLRHQDGFVTFGQFLTVKNTPAAMPAAPWV